ncbi:Inorganic phosphate transport protein PHO88 [Smittium culicis]|uniref:Inorganic phosphate transport protein PHO88 n=1 Tax=Smittium culicis TaxID=133412 RepID=A0A1R1YIM3_9FUNG|nr:Inorganic phosphate transport protein PHO88 [Smittium culicis]
MGLIFGSIQVAKYIKIDQPENLNQLRTLFITTTLIFYSLCLVVRQVVISKNNTTAFEYVEPPAPGKEESTPVKTTVCAYDLDQINKLIKSSLFSTIIVSALHLYFKITQPLIIQSVLPLFSLLKSPNFCVNILGFAPTASFERPWVVRSAFGNFESQPSAVDSTATTAAAAPAIKEKSNASTKKTE